MKNLKIVSDNDLKDWAKEIFKKNSFKMIDVSKKKETLRANQKQTLASKDTKQLFRVSEIGIRGSELSYHSSK